MFLLLKSLYQNRLNVIFAAQIPHHLVFVFLFRTRKITCILAKFFTFSIFSQCVYSYLPGYTGAA